MLLMGTEGYIQLFAEMATPVRITGWCRPFSDDGVQEPRTPHPQTIGHKNVTPLGKSQNYQIIP